MGENRKRRQYDDEPDVPVKGTGIPVWVWIAGGGLVALVLLVGAAGAIAVAVLAARSQAAINSAPPNEDNAEPPAKAILPRDEFRAVMGMTQARVIDAVGEPDDTSEIGDLKFWHYHNASRDPITNKIDFLVQIEFRQGKVVKVNFH